MSEAISIENIFEIDIPALALDSRFGSLVFENANKKLVKAQLLLKEARDLNYKELLNERDAQRIDTLLTKLGEHLQWLKSFDIGTVDNAKQEHDNFEARIDGFYNDVYEHMAMRTLPFLREERRRENPDEKQLDEEVTKVVQLRTDLENELKKIREETQKIRTADKQVGSAKGQRAAVRMAAHFDAEVTRYAGLAQYWLWGVLGGYVVVVIVLILLGIMTTSYVTQIIALPETVDTSAIWSAVVSKLVILAALWYGLSFIIKNYNVNSHLSAVNRHRAAVARTLEDFIAVEQQQENPNISGILQNATEAMFKNMPIGFVSKTEKEASNPVLQIVNDLMGVGKQ